MTEPTQAQTIRINGILHRVMRSMMGQEYFVPIAEDQMTEPTQAQIDAALKAYSEAGAGHRGGMIAALTAAAQVEKTYATCDADFIHAATIERCAQVADKYAHYPHSLDFKIKSEIAAAIRALATEGK